MNAESTIPPPSIFLPGIKQLGDCPMKFLQNAVDHLHLIYVPEVRGSRRRRFAGGRQTQVSKSSSAPLEPSSREKDLQILRSDTFERSFSVRWLTALTKVLAETSDCEDNSTDISTIGDSRVHHVLLDRAASLLASCSGASATGVISRKFSFSSPPNEQHGAFSVEIILTDVPLVNADYGTVGAQTWGGACVLSEMIVEDPCSFNLAAMEKDTRRTLRVLELGSGTGLVGLTVSKLLMEFPSRLVASPGLGDDNTSMPKRKAEVFLTDFHPVVLENLRCNVEANISSAKASKGVEGLEVDVRVTRLDWEAVSQAAQKKSTPSRCDSNADGHDSADIDVGGQFDIVFGADIIYEAQHALWIRACLEKMLAPSPSAAFHLIIPLRSTHSKESSTIEQTFPRAESPTETQSDDTPYDSQNPASSSCGRLVILSQEEIICDALLDGADEVIYTYYKIGWEGLPLRRSEL